jgi:hypothetical protein
MGRKIASVLLEHIVTCFNMAMQDAQNLHDSLEAFFDYDTYAFWENLCNRLTYVDAQDERHPDVVVVRFDIDGESIAHLQTIDEIIRLLEVCTRTLQASMPGKTRTHKRMERAYQNAIDPVNNFFKRMVGQDVSDGSNEERRMFVSERMLAVTTDTIALLQDLTQVFVAIAPIIKSSARYACLHYSGDMSVKSENRLLIVRLMYDEAQNMWSARQNLVQNMHKLRNTLDGRRCVEKLLPTDLEHAV